jgi:hypothetical protein
MPQIYFPERSLFMPFSAAVKARRRIPAATIAEISISGMCGAAHRDSPTARLSREAGECQIETPG